ncbi:zinc finger CCCH domain-containing protein 24-like [Iris pallida]|uniref:Zinc finger CCCH domain-containing protein 24-like n=1 Tax=Iris pallida TaxID=29817 RepID=A0AAX6EVD9_IRIPA|nr:zinc finger CCCH domain-containing protein 24-like [Iris pallida]KAJ6811709.1 zinc finger CCCH domain-containing protein 24-like [Iris pallida]
MVDLIKQTNSLLTHTMCGGPPPSSSNNPPAMKKHLTVETDDTFSSLLELAANNDLDGFKRSSDRDSSAVDEIGLWYGRKKGSNLMVLQHRTPLMVAATYGSIEVLVYIVSELVVDVNRSCGEDGTTALHCAASGGSENAVQAVKILLAAGADPKSLDANGFRPADVIVVSPRLSEVKVALEELLGGCSSVDHQALRVLMSKAVPSSPPRELSLSPEDCGSPLSNSASSPGAVKYPELQTLIAGPEKKEYPVDLSLPDIKNSIYATDEFRMFSFKVRPCSRAYSHDWTECPFVHPGENARRRDPRKYHYSCVPCPDFRKGACRRGDLCEYAHGVFECWLHPAQYRTRLCKDGMSCNRRVCFFAHTNEELRPLYMSTGSAVPSPRSSASAAMDMAVAMGLMPSSPSSVSAVMPPFTPPMSPSNGLSHSTLNWPQPNVPTLHLPGSSLQSSRLRSSLSARDMPVDDYSLMQDFEAQQLINDFCLSRLGTPSVGNRSARSKTLTPSNLEDLFTAEISSSPRYNSEQGSMFSPSHKTAILNQFQQQQQSLLSPINTGVFSPKSVDPQRLPGHNALLQASLAISSPGRMSPRGLEPISPMSSRLAAIAQREKQQQTLRSLSSRDLGSGSSATPGASMSPSWSKWGSPSGAADWGVNGEELGRLRRSSSFELRSGGEEPDLSWVHTLVRESPPEKLVTAAASAVAVTGAATTPVGTAALAPTTGGEGSSSVTPMDGNDQAAALGAWLEQMQLDQMVV